MIAAFWRLISILIASIMTLFLCLFGVRQVGLSQQFAPIDHPLLKVPFVWVGSTSEEPRWEHWRLRLNADRKWQIQPKEGEMQPLPEQPKNETGLWLEVIDPTSVSELAKLHEYIKAAKAEKTVVFSSTYQNIDREMRKIAPLWLYGSSVAESARTRFLTSLFLEPIASIDADILVVDKINSPRLTDELRRRHKKIFLQVRPQNEEDLALAQRLKTAQMIDGAFIAP